MLKPSARCVDAEGMMLAPRGSASVGETDRQAHYYYKCAKGTSKGVYRAGDWQGAGGRGDEI